MARDQDYQQREETPRQRSSTTRSKPSDTADRTSNRPNADAERGDRQRAMQTGRETGTSTGIARRQNTFPVYGPGASPFTVMRRMAEDMDRLLENVGFGRTGVGVTPAFGTGLNRDPWRDASALEESVWSPQVETFRRGDKLVVRADLPGLKKEDVKVEVDDGMLAISGERSEENEENRDDFYRSERSYGQFYRAVPLPEGVNADQCDATFKDGVFEVTLPAPTPPERKAKQLAIR